MSWKPLFCRPGLPLLSGSIGVKNNSETCSFCVIRFDWHRPWWQEQSRTDHWCWGVHWIGWLRDNSWVPARFYLCLRPFVVVVVVAVVIADAVIVATAVAAAAAMSLEWNLEYVGFHPFESTSSCWHFVEEQMWGCIGYISPMLVVRRRPEDCKATRW